MDWACIIVPVCVAVVILFAYVGIIAFLDYLGVYISRYRKETLNQISELTGFDADQKVIGATGISGIAIDEKRNKICFVLNKGVNDGGTWIYSWNDILRVEILENAETITRTDRSSQAAGAILGGLILGGAGAIIGGLSGNTKTSSKVDSIELNIIVNDTTKPIHKIQFLNPWKETEKTDFKYKEAMGQVRHWHALISVLIKRADEAEDSG